MKAIEIIKKMILNSDLAEYGGLVRWEGECLVKDWLKQMFGDFRIKAGTLEKDTIYFTLWECDESKISPFNEEYPCDVVIVRNDAEKYGADDREVWLWKVEESYNLLKGL